MGKLRRKAKEVTWEIWSIFWFGGVFSGKREKDIERGKSGNLGFFIQGAERFHKSFSLELIFIFVRTVKRYKLVF